MITNKLNFMVYITNFYQVSYLKKIYFLLIFFLSLMTPFSANAVSVELNGTRSILSGSDCELATYRFGTKTTYDGKALDIIVEVLEEDNDNDYRACIDITGNQVSIWLKDYDRSDNVAYMDLKFTIVEKNTLIPVEVDRILVTNFDLDSNGDPQYSLTDDVYYKAPTGAYISSNSLVEYSEGSFFGGKYDVKMQGRTTGNCNDGTTTVDVTCRAAAIWVNGTNGINKVSSIYARAQNDNAYGNHSNANYLRLLQFSLELKHFESLVTVASDYGDAPSSYGSAGHKLSANLGLGFGEIADNENAHQSSVLADADDRDSGSGNFDDDNAVSLDGQPLNDQVLVAETLVNLSVTTFGAGYLSGWIDWNKDGDFGDVGEKFLDDKQITALSIAEHAIPLAIPATISNGNSFLRFRYTATAGVAESGYSSAIGEVEDYHIILQVPEDYGDAPASYGIAMHNILSTPSLYLGAIIPDIDISTKTPFDGTGDDTDGTDDEDSIIRLAKLTDIDSRYEVAVIVNNNSANSANLVGWIDFDADGVFAADEAATIAVDAGSNNTTVTLQWNNIPTDITANERSYLRLRFTSDLSIATGVANTSQASGIASDGEVEDYPLTIEIGGYHVSGRVYEDSSADSINDASEKGIANLTVVLLDLTNNSCVSSQTDENGHYTFFPVIPSNYQLYEAPRETVPTPASCDVNKAKDPSGYRSTTPNALAQFSVVDADVTGKDFGDIKSPRFFPNHTGTVLAGNVTFYTHQLTANSTGFVTFFVSSNDSVTSGWSSIIYQDADCNGTLNGTEGNAVVASDLPTTAGEVICLINKIYAPANVNDGENYRNTMSAVFNFNNNVLAGTTTLNVTDFTKAASNDLILGSSRLKLRKTVQNMTQEGAETEIQNQAKSSDVLKYRIYYSNTGTGVITDLIINDEIPEFTMLQGAADCQFPLPAGLTSCTGTVNDSAVKWTFGANDVLEGGASGVVSYQVKIE